MGNSRSSNPFPHSLPLPLPSTNSTNKPPTRCQSMTNLNDPTKMNYRSKNESAPPPSPSDHSDDNDDDNNNNIDDIDDLEKRSTHPSSKRRTNSTPSSARSINPNTTNNIINYSNKTSASNPVHNRRLIITHYCTNCNVQCRNPQLFSERFEIFCSGECYFSHSIRGDPYDIDNNNDDIEFINHFQSINKDRRGKDAVLSRWEINDENNNGSDNHHHRPKQSKPIKIPLPYPNYVPY